MTFSVGSLRIRPLLGIVPLTQPWISCVGAQLYQTPAAAMPLVVAAAVPEKSPPGVVQLFVPSYLFQVAPVVQGDRDVAEITLGRQEVPDEPLDAGWRHGQPEARRPPHRGTRDGDERAVQQEDTKAQETSFCSHARADNRTGKKFPTILKSAGPERSDLRPGPGPPVTVGGCHPTLRDDSRP